MAYFATVYTIHFDDTMAYGSHHFLTAFRFQCAARESLLFGEHIFDSEGVREALRHVHLLTVDAYSRNLNPTQLGDRVAILLTLEDWAQASARFCYRVIGQQGQPICAGFQTLLCADSQSGNPTALPEPLRRAMDELRAIEEPPAGQSFRDRVLAGGARTESLFGKVERATAVRFLTDRYPQPRVLVPATPSSTGSKNDNDGQADLGDPETEGKVGEAWVFCGQGALDSKLLSQRVDAFKRIHSNAADELDHAIEITDQLIGGDAWALVSGSAQRCSRAVRQTPQLSQVGIHLQNVLGAAIRRSRGQQPAVVMGHSFGEIAALEVAGCYDLPTGVHIVCSRVQAIATHAAPDGSLLAVAADRQVVATESALLGLHRVVVAGRNHDRQTIVSGPQCQLDELRTYLKTIGIDSVPVASPTAFHHPELRTAARRWLEQLRSLPISTPTLPVYTPIGRRVIGSDDDVAATLASQFLRPFDLQGAIHDLFQWGVTTFIDCGSAGSLSKLIRKAGPAGMEVGDVDYCGSNHSLMPKPADNASTTRPDIDKPAVAQAESERAHQQPDVSVAESAQRDVIPRIGIVGQGCILPAGATSPEQLLEAINEQRSGIVDQRRFDANWKADFYSETLVPDRSTSFLTGRVDDRDIVVPAGIDPNVFRDFTRAQRLLCIALAPCLAGLQGANTIHCFVGATADGFEDQDEVYSLRLAGIDPLDPDVDRRRHTARSAFQTPHSAVQDVFDRIVRPGLEVTLVDAACASSLYSVALGMQALETHEADAVIAGGVFCPGPGNSCLFSQFQGTTSTGCRPFDANADGVVFSEGSAFVVLRRVADAQEKGLPISAVVRGAGLSSDGRSSSANVPQTKGQLLSLERCYANYDIQPSSIHAVEAHGTSTPVGDSTELNTLKDFFADHAKAPIVVHSLKGLLGHAGWSAGTASLIAANEYLRVGVFPPQAHHRSPSAALKSASKTLHVPNRPVRLSSEDRRIAIDGFGFGGANAHVVLERYDPDAPVYDGLPFTTMSRNKRDNELVIVAHHQLTPTIMTREGKRFDVDQVKHELGGRYMLLPDLADDMDVTQALAVSLVDEIVRHLPQFDESLRRETSIVLAQSGKTRRGVEATLRVLAQRLQRELAGLSQATEAIDKAVEQIKPSGPYTLQCMMPNVAAGRAALLLNLNGPNFVVDSGSHSLEMAMSCAGRLLKGGELSGTKLAIVAAIDSHSVAPGSAPHEPLPAHDDYAAAFAITTRRLAEQLGLRIVSELNGPLHSVDNVPYAKSTATTNGAKLDAFIGALDAKPALSGTAGAPAKATKVRDDAPGESESPIHVPIWIEAPMPSQAIASAVNGARRTLVIARDQWSYPAELNRFLQDSSAECLVAIVGPRANQVAASIDAISRSDLLPINLADQQSVTAALDKIERFQADLVLGLESVSTWEFAESLAKIANDNSLCESLFLVAQRYADRLTRGQLEVWGLFLNGWNGLVHPTSGATAGLLKSIHREFPESRTGVICTRDLSVNEALDRLLSEHSHPFSEQELVFDGNKRLVRRFRKAKAATTGQRPVHLDSESVVIASGGARGVTSVLVESLLRDFQCTVIALGRSPLEAGPSDQNATSLEREFYEQFVRENASVPVVAMKTQFEQKRASWEAHANIEQLAALGGQIAYIVADVQDRQQVAAAVREIAQRYGRVDLLVHGAGIQLSKRLRDRTLSEFRKTFSIKVTGLYNLVECCRDQFGRTVPAHLLTSAYSVFGNDGQHDYGAANEALDRLCELSRFRDDGNWSSIAWLAWDGVGMTRGSEYQVLAKQRGLSGLNAKTGQPLFREVLEGQTHSAINVPVSDAEHLEYGVKTIPAATNLSGGHVGEIPLKLSDIHCLPYHRIRNMPTLPGAWILDRMIHAGKQLVAQPQPLTTVIVNDVAFSRLVRLMNGREPNIRVVAEETRSGIVAWMIGDVIHPSGAVLSRDTVFAKATLCFVQKADDSRPDSGPWRQVFRNGQIGERRGVRSDPYCQGSSSDVALSGAFDCLREIEIGHHFRRARFMPDPNCNWSGDIPALLLDAAWRLGAMYADPDADALFIPVRIGRVTLPVGMPASSHQARGWQIYSSQPELARRNVRWDYTEVRDELGKLRLSVEDALATWLP